MLFLFHLNQFLANLVPINNFSLQQGDFLLAYLLTYVLFCKLSLSSVVHHQTLTWIYSASNSTLQNTIYSTCMRYWFLWPINFVLEHCFCSTEVTVAMALGLREMELVTSSVRGWKPEINIVLYKIKDLGISIHF